MSALEGKSIGFLGAGMMAEAIIRGLLVKNIITSEQVYVSDPFEPRRTFMRDTLHVNVCETNDEVAASSDVIVLAVKPHNINTVLEEVEDNSTGKLFVSIAAGITLAAIEGRVHGAPRVVRVMPNTPCLVNASASGFAAGKNATEADTRLVEEMFSALGVAKQVPEYQLDAVTGLSGSGPAYVFMFIEALADGGVKMGLARDVARQLAAQTVFGAAKMVMENPGVHPAELRNRVESPGGTTIAATHSLESNGFRAAVIDAVVAATQKAKELGSH